MVVSHGTISISLIVLIDGGGGMAMMMKNIMFFWGAVKTVRYP